MAGSNTNRLIVVLIVIVLSVFGYLIYTNIQLKKQIKVVHKEVQRARSDADDAYSRADEANDRADDIESDLDDANDKIDDLESERDY